MSTVVLYDTDFTGMSWENFLTLIDVSRFEIDPETQDIELIDCVSLDINLIKAAALVLNACKISKVYQ